MKNLNKLFALALFAFNLAHAEPVSLEFKGATVVDVVQTLVKEVLKQDYVIAPEVATSDKRITVSVRKVEPDQLLPLIDGILKTVGVSIESRGGVLYVERMNQVSNMVQSSPIPVIPSPMPQNQFPNHLQGQGITSFGNNAQQAVKVPDFIETYRPRGKTVEFLASVAKAAGALVIEYKGKADQLVYSGTKEAVEKARKILSQVDSAPSSVNVRAVLVEYTDGRNESRSLNMAINLLAGKLGIVYQAGSNLANGVILKSGTMNAVLSAIDGDSRFKYLAEPNIKVLDGETAKLVVGSEVPTRGAITTDKNGNSQQSIDYRTAGVVINLEPRVLDGMVSLKVSQQLSSFALTTTSNIDSPTILKREAQTTVSVRPGELVVLAGMDEERTSSSSSGLSFLPDWMRSKNEEGSRSQLVLLLEVIPEEI